MPLKKRQEGDACWQTGKIWIILRNLDYSRIEVAVDARRRPMKLWSSTAIGPQQSRCSEIGSPKG